MAKVSNSDMVGMFPADSSNEPEPRLQVLIVYERSEDGLEALRLYQRLVRRFEHEIDFDVDFRKFEVLGISFVSERSAGEAVEADLVVVAVDGRSELPHEFLDWAESWIDKKVNQDSALVLLASHSNKSTTALATVYAALRRLAIRGEMAFITDIQEAASDLLGRESDSFPRPHEFGETTHADNPKVGVLVSDSSIAT